ncbi:MAG TPA: response regulator [Candidatus Woesebacteria bacterium]|nr:response regulator [Candidatus Woesebacteria bacterium]HNQ16725.1 response regulator [Candidatus Woesebacteria bacterium]HNS65414.1 response regulator [Candidatus Woesebacteria bacterium]
MPNQHKILLVDDDELIRDLYSEVLKDANFDVQSAKDGQEGFEMLKQGGYDVVLLDLIMPELDGVTVLRKLHDNPPGKPNKHIIVLTNLDFQPTLEEAMELGAESYLIKSAHTPDEVVEQVTATASA